MDTVLAHEQAHLTTARAALNAMHEAVIDIESIGVAGLGDHYSAQVLKQHFYRRKQALADDPNVALFFGRLDYRAELGAELDETLYIGRRHVAGELGGEPLVTDWRAPMSLPFYRATPLDPMGCSLRRRFGFHHGELTAYEDEPLAGTTAAATSSALLQDEIEKPRTGPMRDIVATIQPEQDLLVRATLEESSCIQGAPGTGKTAVGLHRAAYLLYTYREQLQRQGIMVIGPHDSFLSYISDVLPALGEIDAANETLESLICRATGVEIRSEDPAAVAVLKGDARLAHVIHRAIWARLATPQELLVVPRGHRTWRVLPHHINQAMHGIRARGIRYEAGRQLLPQQLAHQVLLRMEAAGDSPDDRVQNAVARTREIKAACAALWPKLSAAQIIFSLLSDPLVLAEHADGILTPAEQALLLWPQAPRSATSARWSLADAVLLDEAADVLTRTPSLGHLIIDEAQDLSPMALRAVGRRASTGSVTLLGDLAQATTPWATTRWSDALTHLGKPEAAVHELTAGFRVPGEVIDYAAQLLPQIAPGLATPHSVRRGRGELTIHDVDPYNAVADYAHKLTAREGTIGIIAPESFLDAVGTALTHAGLRYSVLGSGSDITTSIELVSATLAKGLEFDHVCLVDPSGIVAAEADQITGLRRLYVCLTRAVSSLIVLNSGPMPGGLVASCSHHR